MYWLKATINIISPGFYESAIQEQFRLVDLAQGLSQKCSQIVVCSHGHQKAWLRLRDLLQEWFIYMPDRRPWFLPHTRLLSAAWASLQHGSWSKSCTVVHDLALEVTHCHSCSILWVTFVQNGGDCIRLYCIRKRDSLGAYSSWRPATIQKNRRSYWHLIYIFIFPLGNFIPQDTESCLPWQPRFPRADMWFVRFRITGDY